MNEADIIHGLINDHKHRAQFETELYHKYEYFIKEGCRKFHLTHEDSFSAYSDAALSAIHNVMSGRFDSRVSLKTYLFQIFHHKCVDRIRRITNKKQQVHQSGGTPELLGHLPDAAKTVVEKLIDQEKITRVTQCLEIIDEKCKEILLLSVDGYSDKQIAEKLAYHNAAVAKTSRLRCREKLTKLLSNDQ